MTIPRSAAFVYGTPAGIGGLGLQVANAAEDLCREVAKVVALGPGAGGPARLPADRSRLEWRAAPRVLGPPASRFSWQRYLVGLRQHRHDVGVGRWAAGQAAAIRPDLCYCFTQVALETLRWAQGAGVKTILESPNGHIRNFREVYLRETRRWGGLTYLGHPTAAMVDRVEEEYERADLIRVSSEWSKRSLIDGGVAADRIIVVPQRRGDITAPAPPARVARGGRLRLCSVATLDLRKGFPYLLRSIRRLGPDRASLTLVGGTVDRATRRLLARESAGLDLRAAPGDPSDAYREADLFVLPTLEDGSPFVVLEAMAAGLPLIVTDQCGNAPLVRPGESGWIVPAGDEGALAAALADALARRADLPAMGARARADWEAMDPAPAMAGFAGLIAGALEAPAPCAS
ncbi:glycosyltransferase family 4 protein (plasmid) [Tundrisphaera sp. TA3]|uniref:glycosyltransferase family 4 protein n=1 Tax=Tundrisphaera sp. TA3 TaxID=3435775 RepID=UPI003EB8D7D8